jgi:hypothetical protein
MTVDNKPNWMRVVLPLVAVLIGTLLTALAFLLATFAAGACRCSRPIVVAFPYATILWSTTNRESLGGALMAFQFPVYALLVAIAKSRRLRVRYALILLSIHIAAAVVGLWFYKP